MTTILALSRDREPGGMRGNRTIGAVIIERALFSRGLETHIGQIRSRPLARPIHLVPLTAGADKVFIRGPRQTDELLVPETPRSFAAAVALNPLNSRLPSDLAETIDRLFKASVIFRRGPWRSFEAATYPTLGRGDWFNNHNLRESIGEIPPAKPDSDVQAGLETETMAAQKPSTLDVKLGNGGGLAIPRRQGAPEAAQDGLSLNAWLETARFFGGKKGGSSCIESSTAAGTAGRVRLGK